MASLGWPYPFPDREWDEIAAFLGELAAREPAFRYLAEVANSVIDRGATNLLAGATSMADLLVAPRPVTAPPFEVVAVRAPGSLHPPRDGLVLVEHLSTTGRNDRIERPAQEAVPLFWRFVIEKFGVQPISAG